MDGAKFDKREEIKRAYKEALISQEVTIPINGVDFIAASKDDLDAYVSVTYMMDDVGTELILDSKQTSFNLTKAELELVIKEMAKAGKEAWEKKLTLLSQVDSASTVEEVNGIQW